MSQSDRAPEANLGLLDATMIGMGAMIGAGIFVLTGLAAEIAGPAATDVVSLAVVTVAVGTLGAQGLAEAGERYVIAVEPDVADEVMNLLRG